MNYIKNRFIPVLALLAVAFQAQAQTPPATWQEHWFEHNQVLSRMYYDDDVAIYFDDDVDRSSTWMYSYMGDLWRYVKQTYGEYSAEGRLYAIFHTGKYSGGHPSTYFDASHDYRDVVDAGAGPWPCDCGTGLDLFTHEVAHIVEGATMGVKNSPAFGIWGDSKWAEVFLYDAYLGLGRTADADRVYNLWMANSDNFPVANTHWFRDWFYPIYSQYGETDVLVRFFELMSQNYPKNGNQYAKNMNWGEFVHFWSGAANANLKDLATNAFGWPAEWEEQFIQAQNQFPFPYSNPNNNGIDITDLGGSITAQYSDSPAAEGVGNLIDNNTGSKFLTFHNSAWVQFQANESHVVTSYSLASANDAPSRDPLNWTLQGSNNGSSWTTLDSRNGEDFQYRFQKRIFSFNNSNAYSYYRLNMVNNSGSILQLSEIELFAEDSNPFSNKIEGEAYTSMAGVQLENTSDTGGGQNVGWIDAGDWMAYASITIPETANYTIEYRVASLNGGGQLSMDLNAGGQVLGSVNIPSTSGWQNWTTVSQTVNIAAGTYDFGIYAQAGGWNLNWWSITKVSNASSARKSSDVVAASDSEMVLFPNPVTNQLSIKGLSPDADISVFDITGNMILKPDNQSESNIQTIDVSTLKPGVYFIQSEGKALRFIKN
ncbi:carbohydrate-binding protein [Fulvivirga ligni]|uniref:carbohydrate-binding protein n=1 Tax=Fulvivirga ligni TaxID=2904246 RepID=UPI001F16EF7E|nr:carbohydrate-binding protein [Fulvivirga ligni]UII19968.1 carbohydrate-binding protein [Fulvivirga ligni]